MSEDKNINEELADENLDTVAGGTGTLRAVEGMPQAKIGICSECHSLARVQTVSFPVSMTCPACKKYALFTELPAL